MIFKNLPRHVVALCLAVATAGCDSTDPGDAGNPIEMDFFFDTDGDGWAAGFTDYPQGRESDVEFVGEQRELPEPLAPAEGLYQRGVNISDDLFMYFKRRIDGLEAETEYEVTFDLEFATDYGEDCTIGVGAGVYLKTGASTIEPDGFVDTNGDVRLNVDKGEQQNDGRNALLIGDIRNGEPGCGDDVPYAVETVASSEKTLTIRSDSDGLIWLFFGSESAFESPHEVYFTRLSVEFTPVTG